MVAMKCFFSALLFGWWDVLGGCQDIGMWLSLGVLSFIIIFFLRWYANVLGGC